jgi:hypothetical protein
MYSQILLTRQRIVISFLSGLSIFCTYIENAFEKCLEIFDSHSVVRILCHGSCPFFRLASY